MTLATLDMLRRRGQFPPELQRLQSVIERHHLSPNSATYHAAMRACALQGLAADVIALFQEAKAHVRKLLPRVPAASDRRNHVTLCSCVRTSS
jgi:hypothetical protein